ncbi:hypothetical protein CONLIGDRAFT_654116 [Coniochaeta ligniaria NRRL 30616]|uniref:AttH domain-containing protein n=1 Tax=Coniochaeta ligniaria NRRL 30616 TaxID=1408157 RepID=A0A1J7IQU0_9PEZI|nr:hypothetical protein CONLIGDRAFT_654116 [Coniochaeta ligniaria NRRL 30616]
MLRYVVSALALLPVAALAESVTLPNVLHDGPITPDGISAKGHIDWPKLLPGVNATSYDWWYFDVVSADAKASATVVFYNSGPNGFINTFLGGPLSASLIGVLPNGTVYDISVPATSAIISRSDDSSATSAVYTDSGFSFNGTSTSTHHGKAAQRYVVTIDAPELGVTGTLTLDSLAPAHYPCGPDSSPGQTELLFPHVWWSNAVPDAAGEVDLLINGTEVKFDGVGYHDKNWGDTPFVTTTSTWYWGHARLGPYSIVWFDAFDSAGVEHYSGYVAKDGKVLLGSCAQDAVVVRPWGINGEFPPKIGTGVPQGLEVVFDLGYGKTFWANRTLGTVTGGLGGGGCDGRTYQGASLFEEFKLTQ